jgi:hypothetical protein
VTRRRGPAGTETRWPHRERGRESGSRGRRLGKGVESHTQQLLDGQRITTSSSPLAADGHVLPPTTGDRARESGRQLQKRYIGRFAVGQRARGFDVGAFDEPDMDNPDLCDSSAAGWSVL